MTQATRLPHRRIWQVAAGLALAAALSACSTQPRAVAPVEQDGGAVARDVAPASAPAASPAPAVRSAAPASAAKVESTLGTQWGEGLESVVKNVRAPRLTPSRPRDVGEMRYSDMESIHRALGKYAERQTNALLGDGDVEMALASAAGVGYPIFATRGAKDYHVAGRAGDRYNLVYTNRSKRYYEVVATVDGLDVLSGQPGSVYNTGYLLRPGDRLVIDGFRKSDREVAAFRFSRKERAYANNTAAGDARNVGVIGTALFEVRLDEPDPYLAPQRAPEGQTSEPRAFPGDAGRYAPPPQYR